MSVASCSNCDGVLPPEAGFCPLCGQSTKIIKRPWHDVIGDLLRELFDFDGRMLVSLRLLLTRPGILSLDYINGRRAAHTSPVKLYLVISLMFFFILPQILPDTSESLPGHMVSVDLYSQAMFVMLPVFALLLKIFYRQ